MNFVLFNTEKAAVFAIGKDEFEGVKRICGKVAADIELVSGKKPEICDDISKADSDYVVVAGTVGKSGLIDELQAEGIINPGGLKGRRESYIFQVCESEYKGKKLLIIAGSEKRGTIYGLFRISELIGVTPFIYWGDTSPEEKSEAVFDSSVNMLSREPSVKYRGFFINDEWPAFGNWTGEHFNGFTTDMYDKVFEYLLRMKGNYLWPAMWSSNFTLDGPGETSAILADIYGVVMGTSHHEPCLRHSEEWDILRGPDTPYGNDWSYIKNREGLIKYWEDGLKRSGKYENIITVGMRGERDSKLMGDAKLKDNIDVLKDIITEQKKLIYEHVEKQHGEVPKMLAVYKEVEEYFNGDAQTEGLREWDGLDGITLMLCEDNFGNLRNLPDASNRNHKGGWGMYYHFDYHGSPISYEWVNSSYLPKVWEQMSMAYDFGIRDIWIVNVGDLKYQEYPLGFFMSMAYDMDSFGSSAVNCTDDYTRDWIDRQFEGLCKEHKEAIFDVLMGYTKLSHNRKPEALAADTYHPVHYRESERVLKVAAEIEKKADALLNNIDKKYYDAYYSMIYFIAKASLNLLKMQLYAGMNALYAAQGRVKANYYAELVDMCLEQDEILTKEFHEFKGGKWNGMGLSEHIGFINWNDEGCKYPVKQYVTPLRKTEMIVAPADSTDFSVGGPWIRHTLCLNGFKYSNEAAFDIANAGKTPIEYTIVCDNENVVFSSTAGCVDVQERINVTLKEYVAGKYEFTVNSNAGLVNIYFEVPEKVKGLPKGTVIMCDGIACVEAEHFIANHKADSGEFKVINGYGKTRSGIKAFPSTAYFEPEAAPALEYGIYAEEDDEYELLVYSAPSNPVKPDMSLCFGIKVNDENPVRINTIPEGFIAGESISRDWSRGVLDQIRITKTAVRLKKGVNNIRIMADEPGFVLEKLVFVRKGTCLPNTYLGPVESRLA